MDKHNRLGSRISAIFAMTLIAMLLVGCTQNTPSDPEGGEGDPDAATPADTTPLPAEPSEDSPTESPVTKTPGTAADMSTESIEDTIVGTILPDSMAPLERPTEPLTVSDIATVPTFGEVPPASMPAPGTAPISMPGTSPMMMPPGSPAPTIGSPAALSPYAAPPYSPTPVTTSPPYSPAPIAASPAVDNTPGDFPPYHGVAPRGTTPPVRTHTDPAVRPAATYGAAPSHTSQPITGASELTQDSIPLRSCQVSLIDDIDVPAKESGVLTDLPVREGSLVTEGDVIAKVDQRIAILQEKAALNRLQVADKEATNRISVEYAKATAEVAWAEILAAEAANARVPGTVTTSELRRLKLQHYEATQSIKNAEKKLEIAALQANVARAELDAAKEGVDRRQVRSPLTGEVTKRYKNKGEWVQPGEPVLRMIRLDVLRVEGQVDPNLYSPSEIDGRPVTVEVALERGRREQFKGKIVFADPTIQSNNTYRVWAEVNNGLSPDGRHWLLGPGRTATMTIHLNNTPVGL